MSVPRQIGLFATFFFLYLLLGSREMPWNDAKVIHEAAESLVKDGSLAVPTGTAMSSGAKFYSPHSFLPTLIHVPGAALSSWLGGTWPEAAPLLRVFFSHLGPAAMGALTCLLFVHLVGFFGVSTRAASLGAVALGAGTLVGIYARSLGSEAVEAACFTGFFLALVRLCAAPIRAHAVGFGIWAGLLLNAKIVFLLSLPGAAAMAAFWIARTHGKRALGHAAAWAAAGVLPALVVFLGYNHARTGTFFTLGVPSGIVAPATFGQNVFFGLWGLLLSPGKSLLLYCPPLLLALFALPRFARSQRGLWLAGFLLTAGPVLLLVAKFVFWHGDWSWGPRFIVFLVPVALVPAAMWLNEALAQRRALALVGATTLLAAGMAAQILGGSLSWDHGIRVAHEVRPQWLGIPNRTGSQVPDRGGFCDPCLEDLYAVHWLPPFQPMALNAWMLSSLAQGKPPNQAAVDGPWARYTRLSIGVGTSYPRARLDFWVLDWKKHLRPKGIAGAVLLALGLLTSILAWTGRLRLPVTAGARHAPPQPAPEL